CAAWDGSLSGYSF
nr:immunoglobulin light chain junction region [Macaca mulatta]MPO03675.1 immunoglobulin light chain junction region [Macaca mulatta]MPO04046.1 immunoglobulin light chain junction region [Macaca mulatta]MPO04342.1 immunoglobulin light chain junction region [Macaca mulatta]MPO05995.1 immunoglobulin light chain junction region [Macaca mulatta]